MKNAAAPAYDRTSEDAAEIRHLLGRREALVSDADAIVRLGAPHDWPALKARIDRDLEDKRLAPIPPPPERTPGM